MSRRPMTFSLLLLTALLLGAGVVRAENGPPGVRLSGRLLVRLLLPGADEAELPLGGEVEAFLRFTPKGPLLHVMARQWDIEGSWGSGEFQGEAWLRFTNSGLVCDRFELRAPEAVIRLGDTAMPPVALSLSGKGGRLPSGGGWEFGHLELQVGDVVLLQGRAMLEQEQGLTATLGGEVADVSALQAWLRPLLPGWLLEPDSSGGLGLSCRLTPNADEAEGLALEAILQPRELVLWDHQNAGALSGLARFTAHLGHGGSAPAQRNGLGAWRLEANLALPGGAVFNGAQLALALAGEGGVALLEHCNLRPHPAAGTNAGLDMRGELTFAATPSENADENGLWLRDLRLSSQDMGAFEGELFFGQDSLRAAFSGQGLDVPETVALARGFWNPPFADTLAAWNPNGRLDLELLAQGERTAPQYEVRLALDNGACATPDGEFMAQDLGLRLLGQLRGGGDAVREWSLAMDVDSGGVLWSTVYLDFATAPFKGVLRGSGPDQGKVLRLAEYALELHGHGRLAGAGQLMIGAGPMACDLRLVSRDLNLGALFGTFLQQPLAVISPEFSTARLEGEAGLELRITGGGSAPRLEGRLDLGNMAFATEDLILEGVRLELPLAYDFGKTLPTGEKDRKTGVSPGVLELDWGAVPAPDTPARDALEASGRGRLQVSRVQTPLFLLERLDLPVWLTGNTLGLGASLDIPVHGGLLRLGAIRVLEPFSSGFELRCRASVQGVNLGAVMAGPLVLQGALAGELGEVRLTREFMSVAAGLPGRFFGGELLVDNLRVHRPLTAGRVLGADVQVRGMHLGRLSQALDLGDVSGRLDVDIEGLELAHGQPVAFAMQAVSAPAKGVEQRISLKAVNAISVMGTGQGLTGVGVSMFAPFFQSFAYKSIGFACSLRNDVFQIRGLIKDGGVEYLIKKPPLFGINVVNGNPDNRISFSDMQKRLERALSPGSARVSERHRGMYNEEESRP
jgi:hypothetical protein